MTLPLFTFLFAIPPPPPRRPTNRPTSLPQNKHTLFATKCFCFNYFNLFHSLRDWGGVTQKDGQNRRGVGVQREPGRQRKEEEEEKRSSCGGGEHSGLANTFRVRNTFGWGTRSLRPRGSTGRRVRIFGESERSEPSGVAKLFRVGNALGRGDARGCFRRCGDRPPARERGRASLRLSRGCAVLRSKSVSGMNFFGSVLDAVRRGGRAVR